MSIQAVKCGRMIESSSPSERCPERSERVPTRVYWYSHSAFNNGLISQQHVCTIVRAEHILPKMPSGKRLTIPTSAKISPSSLTPRYLLSRQNSMIYWLHPFPTRGGLHDSRPGRSYLHCPHPPVKGRQYGLMLTKSP